MTTDPPAAPATPAEPTRPDPRPPSTAATEAVEHLFRYASRVGRVHPLQHLLQRYRAGERA